MLTKRAQSSLVYSLSDGVPGRSQDPDIRFVMRVLDWAAAHRCLMVVCEFFWDSLMGCWNGGGVGHEYRGGVSVSGYLVG